SVAHLAGAMGKPVWLLNAQPGDWRWFGTSDRTPWYPSMRIFRQPVAGDWHSVIVEVGQALRTEASFPSQTSNPVTDDMPDVRMAPLDPTAQAKGIDLLGAVAETRFGIVQHVPDGTPASIAIRWYGDYLTPHLEVVGAAIRRGSTVLELGSGVGMHALAISAKIGDEGHLLAWEGDPRLRKLLRQNLVANRVRNATPLRGEVAAAGESPSRVDGQPAFAGVDALRLETLALLKCGDAIDAEAVLLSAQETLWRLRPAVFAHTRDAATALRIGRGLRDQGYRCWYLQVPLFDSANFDQRRENVFGGRTAHAVWAVAEESDPQPVTDDLREIE
ncbi:MAG: hypothetical protein ABI440_12075, partial [Casimicrobiaceae bacterium]